MSILVPLMAQVGQAGEPVRCFEKTGLELSFKLVSLQDTFLVFAEDMLK